MPRLTLRIDFSDCQLGPGKVRLLEFVHELKSISAAGKAMDMSYRRAWLLIDELNAMFKEPLVETRRGGRGGNATLSELGLTVVRLYRDIERDSITASSGKLAELERQIQMASGRRSLKNGAPSAHKG